MGGTPITLRCAHCKRGENWRSPRSSHKQITKTGRERWRTVSRRPNAHQVEVLHAVCGRKFWTMHPDWTTNHPIRLGPGA